MSALMKLPRSSRGTGMPSTGPYGPAALGTASAAMYTRSVRRNALGGTPAREYRRLPPARGGAGVVSALAVMHAARVDAEAQARVDVDALLQLGHADHDVIDAGQHALLVIRRRVTEPRALRLVVVDPQLRLALLEDVGDPLQRGERLIAAGVHRRHPTVLPVVAEVDGVAAEHERAGLGQHHEQ